MNTSAKTPRLTSTQHGNSSGSIYKGSTEMLLIYKNPSHFSWPQNYIRDVIDHESSIQSTPVRSECCPRALNQSTRLIGARPAKNICQKRKTIN